MVLLGSNDDDGDIVFRAQRALSPSLLSQLSRVLLVCLRHFLPHLSAAAHAARGITVFVVIMHLPARHFCVHFVPFCAARFAARYRRKSAARLHAPHFYIIL